MRVNDKKPAFHSQKSKNGRLHHWLVSTKLDFMTDNRPGVLCNHNINVTITNDRHFVTAHMIGRAQQMSQVQLLELLGDPSLKILNVHINSINYLGEMLKEEFYTPPLETASAADGAPAAVVQAPAANDPFQTT